MSFRRKLRYLVPSYRRALEKDMAEELQALSELADTELAGAGELGNLTRAAEEARAIWGWVWVEQLSKDVQYALRNLRHNPGFTATAVLSLAMGIGANTAIFSLMDALMLRWLPVRNPSELVQLGLRGATDSGAPLPTFSYPIVNAMADAKDIFANACGFSSARFAVGSGGSLSRTPGEWVTGDYFETLGLNPAMGRLLTRDDDRPGAALTAVISYGYWERHFGSSQDAIGGTVRVDGVPVTIVGVSPPGFEGTVVGAAADITLAVAAVPRIDPAMASLLGPGNFWLQMMARPKTGMSDAQVQARLAVEWPQMAESVISPSWPADRRKEMAASKFVLSPGGTGYSALREMFRRPLLVLMAVTGLVLLIACANVACLLLARATARQREISVRLAIGAGRGRIVRQLLTESVLLSLMGAVAGVGLAWLGSRFLVRIFSGGGALPLMLDLTPNWHVVAFASTVAIGTAILFGLGPAFQTTAAGGAAVVRDGDRIAGTRSRLLPVLVSVQVALSFVLLVGAGLFVTTFRNLLKVDPGFRREGVLLVDIDGQREGYQDARLMAFYEDLLDRARRVPGVTSASLSSHTPLSGSSWSEAAVPKGERVPERDNALFIAAGPRLFATLETPLIAGRDFNERDRGTARVAIINQAYAKRYFGGRNPLGEYLTATVTRPPSDLQIIGVVKDSLSGSLRGRPRPTVYVSYFQRPARTDALEIRVAGSISEVAAALRRELQPSFPDAPVEVRALTDQVERTLVQERLMASLAGGFGALGLVLACAGLYGLLAYSVVRRTKEIGVRMALGARPGEVAWTVARHLMWLVAAGLILGLPAAWGLTRLVRSMLFGLSPTDASVVAMAVLLLGVAGAVAAYVPASRATHVDPIASLRHE